jgi:hypothetical protein
LKTLFSKKNKLNKSLKKNKKRMQENLIYLFDLPKDNLTSVKIAEAFEK